MARSKNTMITYRYRDGGGNSTHRSVVVGGEMSAEEKAELISCLDSEGFIPSQVGLEDLQSDLRKYDVDDDDFGGLDHVWHTLAIEEIEETSDKPTLPLSAKKLVQNFRSAKGKWDLVKADERLHGY
jgi:hypothetical protein